MFESRVLIADADKIIRNNLCQSLDRLGYLVIGEADNGKSTVDIARQLRPDVVLADAYLPHLNGIEVAHILRDERLAPVILIAAQSNRDLATQACRAGVMAYLIKPIQEEEIIPVVEVACSYWDTHCQRHEELHRLREQLETRSVIERAKGFLMDSHGLRESEAFRKIQKLAMNNRKPMKEVAQAILLTQHMRI